MAGLDDLSEKELQQLLFQKTLEESASANKTFSPEITKPSGAGKSSMESMMLPLEKGQTIQRMKPLEDLPESFKKPALNQMMLGYYPQAVGGLKSVLGGGDYLTERDKALSSLKAAEAENPKVATLGAAAGLGASMLLPIGAVSRGTSLLGNIAKGAASGAAIAGAQNPGDVEGKIDPLQLEQRLGAAKTGAMFGAAIPAVAGGIEKIAKSDLGQKSLKHIADSALVKQTGAMLKDMRQIFGKNQTAQMADALRNETVVMTDPDGKQVVEKLYKFGDTFDDVAKKSAELKNQVGEKIGSVYQKIDDALTNPSLQITESQAIKLAENPRFNPVQDTAEIQQMIADKYGKKIGGKAVLDKVNGILEDFQGRSDSLTDALALKGELDGMINHAKMTKDLPEYQKALMDIRNFIRDKTNSFVDAASEIAGVKAGDLQKLNKTYGSVSQIADISADRVARESANRMYSLTDYLAGGAVGSMAGNENTSLPERAIYGLAGAVGNRMARKYGPGALSTGALKASEVAGKAAPFANQIAPIPGAFANPLGAGLAAGAIERKLKQLKEQGR